MENRHSTLRDHYDLVVMGAGPAGSAAAITAAGAGLTVLQVEAKPFPRHKVCGGCLNPASVELIRQLLGEPLNHRCDSVPLESFYLQHRFKTFTARAPLGRAVDRSQLDQTLVHRARQLGVEFRDSVKAQVGRLLERSRLVSLNGRGLSTCVETSAVVVATGLGTSSTTTAVDLGRVTRKHSRVGLETIIPDARGAFPDGRLMMAVGRTGYVGMTKIPGGRLHLAAAVDKSSLRRLGPDRLVRSILGPPQADWIPRDSIVWRGTPPLTSRALQWSAERVFLVGDAASYIEPFTGEGIRWALESGMGVVPWIQQSMAGWHDSLSRDWSSWYQQHLVRKQRLCQTLAFGLKHAPTRWLAHQALSLRPKLMNEMIARLQTER
jgi:flavin-dependent dehydrogenase